VSGAASRSRPGSWFTSTAQRPGSRCGGAVSTTWRSHTRRRDGLPASGQSAGVCSGLSGRARSCIDTPRFEGLLPGKVIMRVTRSGTPARWASLAARPWPWRAWVRPASSCARKHLQKSVLGSKAGSTQIETRHRVSPYRTQQLGATAKTLDSRRDARSVQSTTARREVALGPSSKTARTPALTSSPGRRGLG
jgi:hypothetical protein